MLGHISFKAKASTEKWFYERITATLCYFSDDRGQLISNLISIKKCIYPVVQSKNDEKEENKRDREKKERERKRDRQRKIERQRKREKR